MRVIQVVNCAHAVNYVWIIIHGGVHYLTFWKHLNKFKYYLTRNIWVIVYNNIKLKNTINFNITDHYQDFIVEYKLLLSNKSKNLSNINIFILLILRPRHSTNDNCILELHCLMTLFYYLLNVRNKKKLGSSRYIFNYCLI